MEKSDALLIIDPQYDFCHPGGTLYVPGADNDMKRLAAWIKANGNQLGHIAVTMDSHPVNAVFHPSFWHDENGNFPAPFTAITYDDISTGKWIPRFFAREARNYIRALEQQGEFNHFIWPYHCLAGSMGAAIDRGITDALTEWALKGKNYQVVIKGTHPLTEHFGIFRANVPLEGYPETMLNGELISTLDKFSRVFIAGEAKSHCVANSLNQVMDHAPGLAAKFIILADCMSDVTGLGHLGDKVYNRARDAGIQFLTTESTAL